MFVSYAQNFEDVILWRALKHVGHGFYIDIGAQDPVQDSVSLAFYQQNWRGVHVEPASAYAEALRKARPDETVIESVIGTYSESTEFYEIAGSGLSTADPQMATRFAAEGWHPRRRTVKAMALATLLDSYEDRDIHWLKIDVEGSELAVIKSWSPSTIRPWIVVVESIDPITREHKHAIWENDLVTLGYQFAYFDGLNRFYVHETKTELRAYFGIGPNIFDGFAVSESKSFGFALREPMSVPEQRELTLNAKLDLAMAQLTSANIELAVQRDRLNAMLASTSWQLTRPMRLVSRAFSVIRKDPAMFMQMVRRVLVAPFQTHSSITKQILETRANSASPMSPRSLQWSEADLASARASLSVQAQMVFDDLVAHRTGKN